MSDLGLQTYFIAPGPPVPVDDDPDLAGGMGAADRLDDGGMGAADRFEGVQLSLDWLCMTMHPSLDLDLDLDEIRAAASLTLGCEAGDWIEKESGKHGYRRGMLGPVGAQIWWDAPDGDHIHVCLPGKSCQTAGENRLRNWMRYALDHGGVPTRCDVNLDDFERVISVEEVLAEIKGANVVTHARDWLVQSGGEARNPDMTGITVYLGSRKSRQRLRVYDKGLESGGELDAVRWELQTRDEAAQTLVPMLVHGKWATVIRSRLVAFVDFRDAGAHSEVEKRPQLGWWVKLLQGVEKGLVYPPKAIMTLERAFQWVDRTVGPTLAVLVAAAGGDMGVLRRIVERGRSNWRPRHHAMLAGAGTA